MSINMELAVLDDGGVVLYSDRPLPHIVKRVEYYRDEYLFMMVYHDPGHEGQLLHYEVPTTMRPAVEASPEILIYSLFKDHAPIGYRATIVQIHGETAMVN